MKLFDTTTSRLATVATLEDLPYCCNPAVAISADGRSILYNQQDNVAQDIMLVENWKLHRVRMPYKRLSRFR